jgi:hypothetical protein
MSQSQVYTPYQSKFFAYRLTQESLGGGSVTQSLSAARVDLNPHQVDAAMFAMRSPVSKGVLLADEVGLGKTIEAALVLAQRWWERRRRLLLITPASLRKQWAQELSEKFSLPTHILDAKRVVELRKQGIEHPFRREDGIIVLSYEYAARVADELRAIPWDLVVCDEAHKLRNVYKAKPTSRAPILRAALEGRQKLLLTATPLQNNLMELYGLISVIDEQFFGSQEAFKAEFGGRAGNTGLALLGRRLEHICKRTLRRQVQKAGLIKYTNRNPSTFDFTPSKLENDLYDSVSAYLQRPDTLAIGVNGRHLVTLVLRKILGSSSFAIAATLDKMIARLERKQTVAEETLGDIDHIADETEDWRDDEDAPAAEADSLDDESDDDIEVIDPAMFEAEIVQLRQYRDLAMSISDNAKGHAMLKALPVVLGEIESKGGRRKAVIFTESVRTQMYLRDLLEANGFAGQTVMLNGSNSDADSKAIYKEWVEKHRGTEAVSGSKSADMKAAIVESFRDDRTILIATESGAEGINLQFCSLIMNYDLPWNPQRVEQRIGRCHRYGQEIDVTVVNFLNRGNQAEARVFELLQTKFQLFDGVFGSSDEVLGAIESGVDIERRILDIVQTCRTNDQINAAFDALQGELALDIDQAKKEARDQILAQMDDKVIERLKVQKADVHRHLNEFKQSLLLMARAELPDAHFHEDHAERFDHDGVTYTTEWPVSEAQGWRFFRLNEGNLAQELLERARSRQLPLARLRFNYSAYDGNLADVASHSGKGGWMALYSLVLDTPAKSYDQLIPIAIADDGTLIPADTVMRLLSVPAMVDGTPTGEPPTTLDHHAQSSQTVLVSEAQQRMTGFLNEEEDRLDSWRDDAKVSYDAQIKVLEKEAREKTKESRATLNLQNSVELKREAGRLKREADNLKQAYFKQLSEIDEQRERMLDGIAAQLNLTPTLTPLFKIQWELT